MNSLGDLAFDLEADQERLEKFPPCYALALADGKRGCQRRHGRMRQQPEDAIGARRQLGIVPVERVAARAVQQGGRRRTGTERRGTERRGLGEAVRLVHVCAQNTGCVLHRARQHHAKRIDNAALPCANGLSRKICKCGRADEFHYRTRHPCLLSHVD